MIKRTEIKQFLIFFATLVSFSAFGQKAPLERTEPVKITVSDSTELADTWQKILGAIQKKNYAQVKEESLKRVYGKGLGHIWPNLSQDGAIEIDSFINIALIQNANERFMSVISDSPYQVSVIKYFERRFPNFHVHHGQKVILYDIYFVDWAPRGKKRRDQNYYILRFVKIDKKFLLFGISLEWPSPIIN